MSSVRSLEWWQLVDRAPVIRAASQVAATGGVLSLRGPRGFGHLEACAIAAKQYPRFGWECLDLSTDGPTDLSSLLLAAFDLLFPALEGGVPVSTQYAGIGISALVHQLRTLCPPPAKHCLVIPFLDDTAVPARSDVDALKRLTTDNTLSVIVSATASSSLDDDPDIDSVELDAFRQIHIKNCLQAGSNRIGFAVPSDDQVHDDLEALCLDDESVVPQAAYAYLRSFEKAV